LVFDFEVEDILRYGSLPEVLNLKSSADRIDFLDSYVAAYLREEVAQEALTRNLDSLVRFLEVASILDGQTMNILRVASDLGVARSTGTFQVSFIHFWLLGFRVKSKLYFFNGGLVRALSGRAREDLNSLDQCYLFEKFILNEFRAYISYRSLGSNVGYWGTLSDN
jgi:predicted AAA+ superfamily ATPase